MTAPDTTHRDQLAATLGNSRLFWGTHADRWNDADWQQRFWEEAADAVITAGWAPKEDPPDDTALRVEYRTAWDAWADAIKARKPIEECKALWQQMNNALDRLEVETTDADQYAAKSFAFSDLAAPTPPTTAPVCDYCGGPHDQGYDGCPEYDAEVAEAEASASVAAPTPPTAEEEESFECEPDDLKGVHVYDPTLEPTPPTTGKWSEAERGDMGR